MDGGGIDGFAEGLGVAHYGGAEEEEPAVLCDREGGEVMFVAREE